MICFPHDSDPSTKTEKRLQLKSNNKATEEESPCDKEHPQIMRKYCVLTQQDTMRTSSEDAALNFNEHGTVTRKLYSLCYESFANRNDSQVIVIYKLSEINGNDTNFSIVVLLLCLEMFHGTLFPISHSQSINSH